MGIIDCLCEQRIIKQNDICIDVYVILGVHFFFLEEYISIYDFNNIHIIFKTSYKRGYRMSWYTNIYIFHSYNIYIIFSINRNIIFN